MLRWLSELTEKDSATVGPEIARLGTLRESGVDAPDGFAMTRSDMRRNTASASSRNRLRHLSEPPAVGRAS
jgi:phosphoenolpyruvate synthase/pyruvate phosphate dikinase